MSLLPAQIFPITVPLIDKNTACLTKEWWLFLYNMSQEVLGTNNSTAAAQYVQFIDDNEIDVNEDTISLRRRVENLERLISDPEIGPTILDVARALMLSQDYLLPDPIPRAQPVSVVSVGASPFSYQALFNGVAVVNGGTVSAVSVSRDGTTFYATSVGSIPLSRLDTVKITYSVAPTLTFFPT